MRSVVLDGVSSTSEVPLDPARWEREIPRLIAWKLSSEAVEGAQRHGVSLGRGETQLRDSARVAALHVLRQQAAIPEVVRALEVAGIPTLLLKGPGLASADVRLARRHYTDVDVLVPPDRIGEAGRVLVELGFVEQDAEWAPQRFLRERFHHAIPFHRDDVRIDLHQQVSPQCFGRRLSFDRMMDEARTVSIAGIHVKVPSVRHATILAALHIYSSGGGAWLRPWRDAAVLLSRPDVAADLADELRRCRLVGPVLRVARELNDGWGVDTPITSLIKRSRRIGDGLRIRALSRHRSWAKHQIGQMMKMSFGEAVGFTLAFTFPDRACLERRYGSVAGTTYTAMRIRWWRDLATRLVLVLLGRQVATRNPSLEDDRGLSLTTTAKRPTW